MVENKNFVYATVGSLPSEGWIALAGNYDRSLSIKSSGFIRQYFLSSSLGYGRDALDYNHFFVRIGPTAVTGTGFSHLEINLGLTYFHEELEDPILLPGGAIGYRYYMPGGILFRAGVGLPEAIYVSIGFGF